jgi:hypothetical protein
MKVTFGELPIGSCFIRGGKTRKKIAEARAASVGGNGRVRTRAVKGDPAVVPAPCPLRYLGVGLRHNPEQVVEIGDGNILRRRRERR